MYLSHALFALTVTAAVVTGAPALADTFRCGQHLIREGMSTVAIKRRCGEPQSIERTQESVVGRRTTGTAYDIGIVTRELWTYEREWGAFPARLTIEEGVAIKIELLTER